MHSFSGLGQGRLRRGAIFNCPQEAKKHWREAGSAQRDSLEGLRCSQRTAVKMTYQPGQGWCVMRMKVSQSSRWGQASTAEPSLRGLCSRQGSKKELWKEHDSSPSPRLWAAVLWQEEDKQSVACSFQDSAARENTSTQFCVPCVKLQRPEQTVALLLFTSRTFIVTIKEFLMFWQEILKVTGPS